jgi:hypothetical protein
MSEITVELSTPFEYALKGEMEKASFITLAAPTFKQIDKIAPIKQAFVSAIADLGGGSGEAAKQEPGEVEAITGPQVMAILYQSKGNMSQVFLFAQALFKEVALVDGEVKLTTPLMEKMDIVDFERMLGEYLANFTAPSLMDGL